MGLETISSKGLEYFPYFHFDDSNNFEIYPIFYLIRAYTHALTQSFVMHSLLFSLKYFIVGQFELRTKSEEL